MTGSLLQIVITIWLGAHPLTYTLPKLYSPEACEATGKSLARRGRPKSKARRVEIECVATDKREL